MHHEETQDKQRPPTPNAIIVLAFGTRGDVQPLAILAASGLTTAFPATTPIFFVSHAEHEQFLLRLWGHPTPPLSNLIFVASPSPAHAAPAAAAASLEESLRPREHLQVCLDVVRQAISLSSSAIILANLFALEAVHLAEAFNLPLIMAHPYPMPSSMPAAFPQQFNRMDPRQYKALRQAQHAHADQRLLSWKDVEHWLWPVCASSWVSFRRMLGLPEEELPYLAGRLAPPLLYLYDELILPRPHYYADNVHVVGYLFPPEQKEEEEEEPYSSLARFLAAAEPHSPGPAFISFGSMISLSALGNLEHAAETLVKAMLNEGNTSSSSCLRFIVDCGGGGAEGPAWAAAMRKAIEKENEKDGAMLFILEEGISHSWLLPKCSVIVHHGGSGTSAAALRAGIAQVTVPFMMDQHMWATQLAWLDVGPSPLSLEALFPSSDEELLSLSEPPSQLLATAIRHASHPSTRLRAAALGRRLRAVGGTTTGIDRCLDFIQAHLKEWPSSSLLPMRRPPSPPLPDGCELLVLSTMEETFEKGEGEGDDEESSTLTVAALQGSESEVAFIHHEIFPPHASQHGNWGYLKHGITIAKEGREGGDAPAPAPAVVILDVGANIGLFGLYLDLYAQEEDEEERELLVVAIEPAPRTFAALKYNLASHGIKHIAVQKAVMGGGEGEEEVKRKGILRFYPHMPGNSALVVACEEGQDQEKLLPQGINPRLCTHLQEGVEELEVELTTISDLLREHGLNKLDLLKVDVEWQEEAVLQGIREDDWPCIAQVVMEVHTGVEGRKERIDLLLKSKGEFTSVVWEVPEWAKDNDQMDNAIVYATRSRGKGKDQASEAEAERKKEEGLEE